MRVSLTGVAVNVAGSRLLDDVSLDGAPGEVVGLIGPNGSGKSTLLRTIYRAVRAVDGVVAVGGEDVWRLSPRESARRTAVVVQESTSDFDFSVEEIVLMGRQPHKRLLERDSPIDREVVADALERTGVSHLARRYFATLSGGEKQRVLIARALAQQSRVLVLDEPTNHLDVRAQYELMGLVRGLVGVTTIVALHDLNLAATYCDRIVVLKGGRVLAHGSVREVLSERILSEAFDMRAHCAVHPATGRFHVAFFPPDSGGQP